MKQRIKLVMSMNIAREKAWIKREFTNMPMTICNLLSQRTT